MNVAQVDKYFFFFKNENLKYKRIKVPAIDFGIVAIYDYPTEIKSFLDIFEQSNRNLDLLKKVTFFFKGIQFKVLNREYRTKIITEIITSILKTLCKIMLESPHPREYRK